jgi:hypothetical protein
MKKKHLKTAVCAALIGSMLLASGCGDTKAVEASEFKASMKKLGLEINDQSAEYKDQGADAVIVGYVKDEYQMELYHFKEKEQADQTLADAAQAVQDVQDEYDAAVAAQTDEAIRQTEEYKALQEAEKALQDARDAESAAQSAADAAAGETPIQSSNVFEITPNAMPSAPSTTCAAKPIAMKGRMEE